MGVDMDAGVGVGHLGMRCQVYCLHFVSASFYPTIVEGERQHQNALICLSSLCG